MISTKVWCEKCGGTKTSPLHFRICNPVPAPAADSVLAIRLYNAQQVAADLAKRLNDLHREACVDEPLAAMLILPLIGDANRIENVLAQLVEVRK